MNAVTLRTWIRDTRARLPQPLRDEAPALLIFAVVLLLSAWLFYEVVEDMVWNDPMVHADTATYAVLQSLRNPVLDRIMITITELGDAAVVWALAIAAALYLAWRRSWRALLYWLAAVGGGSLINTAIKLAMHRARPGDLHYAGASVFSFPSGHSTTNAALYGFLIVLIAREVPLRHRAPIAAAAILFVALVAFSRLYLGAHWLSDVAGGLAFAGVWISLLSLFYTWHHIGRPAKPVHPYGLLAVVCATLVLVGGAHILLSHTTDLIRYAPYHPAPHT